MIWRNDVGIVNLDGRDTDEQRVEDLEWVKDTGQLAITLYKRTKYAEYPGMRRYELTHRIVEVREMKVLLLAPDELDVNAVFDEEGYTYLYLNDELEHYPEDAYESQGITVVVASVEPMDE